MIKIYDKIDSILKKNCNKDNDHRYEDVKQFLLKRRLQKDDYQDYVKYAARKLNI